jgi:hypothetical protein
MTTQDKAALTAKERTIRDRDWQLEGEANLAAEELAKYRWEQTIGGGGKSFRGYAKLVGRGDRAIRAMVNGYAAYIDRGADDVGRTLSECIERAKLGAEKELATEAVAEAADTTFDNVAAHRRPERDAVQQVAKRIVEDNPNRDYETVVQQVAERRVTARQKYQQGEALKRRMGNRALMIEGPLAGARRYLIEAGKAAADGADEVLDSEDVEAIQHLIVEVRILLDKIDTRMSGDVDTTDWDAELRRLTNEGENA